jgi:hypothetical protein
MVVARRPLIACLKPHRAASGEEAARHRLLRLGYY